MNRILIGLYEFDGPFDLDHEPQELPGVLAIIRKAGPQLVLLQLQACNDVNLMWREIRCQYWYDYQEELAMGILYMPGLSYHERTRVIEHILDDIKTAVA